MPTTKTLAVLVLASLGSACTVGPDYVRPDVDTGDGWSRDTVPAEAPGPELAAWWRRFEDPTLERLVERALEQNLDIREATARIAEARALRDATAGGRYPSVETGAGVTRRRQSANGPLPIDRIPGLDRDQTIYEADFDTRWELDLFGGRRRRIGAADARLEAAVEREHGARVSVAAEIARSYFELRGAQHELEARKQALEATRRSAALVRTQHEAGEVPEAAVARADAELAALEAELPPLEAHERAAALAIGVLAGDLPESELGLIDSQADYTALAPLPVGERAELLRRRPDVRAAERTLAAATADVGVATADLFPKLTIGASGGLQSLRAGDLLETASEVGSLGPLITWRVFSGGRVRAEIRAADARVEAAALGYEQAVKQALLDAELALTRYDYGLKALDRQSKAVDAARASYRYADVRYGGGDISLLELLDAERALRNAEDAYARTHTLAATDLVALFKALGGGWQAPDGVG